jgi:hypothetical protein
VIGWPPAALWAATPQEFWHWFEGWHEARGETRKMIPDSRTYDDIEQIKRTAPAALPSIRRSPGSRRGLRSDIAKGARGRLDLDRRPPSR